MKIFIALAGADVNMAENNNGATSLHVGGKWLIYTELTR